ncbi:CCA tRNA nucleotidyltransferase [Sulfurimonas sp.]|uniref:CCA tRNA nucleotidyltransferase n=1 Tax=Sulfurimonas sp. TaxID=2022749 RepID=UPI003D0E6DCC
MKKIQYPIILDKIFEKLNNYNIKPIIIGGYVRDKLLGIASKDIDIELYNLDDINILEKILTEFGTVNEVGKSFSVLKLCIDGLDLDFSLPRTDSKIAKGHRGFKVTANSNLDFKTATSRRDFTINAIGYDVIEQKILDPFDGLNDLKNKKLKAVDLEKFSEDPLRVLRAIQFASRFELEIDQQLLLKCQEIVRNNQVAYLSKERIYMEIEKLLLKSMTPSSGFILLQKMGLFEVFEELNQLTQEEYFELAHLLDNFKTFQNNLTNKLCVITLFTLLTSKFNQDDTISFLNRLSDDKELIHKVTNIHSFLNSPSYTLAMRIDKKVLAAYLKAMNVKNYMEIVDSIEPKINGKELIAQGLKPSKKFGEILEQKYQKQIKDILM